MFNLGKNLLSNKGVLVDALCVAVLTVTALYKLACGESGSDESWYQQPTGSEDDYLSPEIAGAGAPDADL